MSPWLSATTPVTMSSVSVRSGSVARPKPPPEQPEIPQMVNELDAAGERAWRMT